MAAKTPRRPMAPEEIPGRLASLPGWVVKDNRLRRELSFSTFDRAWGYMTSLALVAQAMDHHPSFQNEYTRVVIELWTHDLGGLSTWDFELAEAAERLL